MKNSMDTICGFFNGFLSKFLFLEKILPGENPLYIYSQLPFVGLSFSPGSFCSGSSNSSVNAEAFCRFTAVEPNTWQ